MGKIWLPRSLSWSGLLLSQFPFLLRLPLDEKGKEPNRKRGEKEEEEEEEAEEEENLLEGGKFGFH